MVTPVKVGQLEEREKRGHCDGKAKWNGREKSAGGRKNRTHREGRSGEKEVDEEEREVKEK